MSNVTNKNSKLKNAESKDSKSKQKYRKKVKGGKPINDSKDDSREVRASGSNDPTWYASNPDLLRDAGSYSFGNPLGNSTRVTELSEFDSSITYINRSNLDTPIPGLAVLEYVPTYGGSQPDLPGAFNASNPINTIARSIFSQVRQANSGSWTYEPADLMKYIMAMDSIYMYYAWMRRLYGVCRVYSTVNRYWPKGVVYGSHVDFDDLLRNLADLRYYINTFVVRANQLAVPDTMPIIAKHLLLNAGLYKDKESDKAQMYMFNPRWIYKYNEEETPARLDPVLINSAVGTGANSLLNVADIMGIGDELLSRVLTSEDIGIITGDIMKKFTSFVKLNAVETEDLVYPEYDNYMISQIQNATLVGDVLLSAPDKLGYIYEGTTVGVDAGMLYQQIASVSECSMINVAHPLSLCKDMASIEPADVIEATRMTVSGRMIWSQDNLKFQSLVCECGSEVCTKLFVVNLNAATGSPEIVATFRGNGFLSPFSNIAAISSFDKHPYLTHITADPTTGTMNYDTANAFFDYDNYTVIGRNGLRKLHETALFGLFGVSEGGNRWVADNIKK